MATHLGGRPGGTALTTIRSLSSMAETLCQPGMSASLEALRLGDFLPRETLLVPSRWIPWRSAASASSPSVTWAISTAPRGMPSTRWAMIVRWISSEPPAIRYPGAPRRCSAQQAVPFELHHRTGGLGAEQSTGATREPAAWSRSPKPFRPRPRAQDLGSPCRRRYPERRRVERTKRPLTDRSDQHVGEGISLDCVQTSPESVDEPEEAVDGIEPEGCRNRHARWPASPWRPTTRRRRHPVGRSSGKDDVVEEHLVEGAPPVIWRSGRTSNLGVTGGTTNTVSPGCSAARGRSGRGEGRCRPVGV